MVLSRPELKSIVVSVVLQILMHLVIILADMWNVKERTATRKVASSHSHVASTNDQLANIIDAVIHVPGVVLGSTHPKTLHIIFRHDKIL
jgi:hypothetical protein